MEGVTTAIVGFIFVCVVFPYLVRNKAQYYAALGAVVLVLLLQAVGQAVQSVSFFRFVGFITALLQMAAILLLVLACGGLTPRQLAGEFKQAIEVIRRGGEEKEIIIPLTGEQPRPRDPGAAVPVRPAPRRRDNDAGIPLD